MIRISWLSWLAVLSLTALAQVAPPLSIAVSNETVPAGGVAQIKVSMTEPKPIVRTGLWSDLDTAVFGDLLGIHAAGKLSGLARYADGGLVVDLASPGAPETPAPDYPLLTFAVRVRDNVPVGTVRPVNLNPGSAFWLHPSGRAYDAEWKPGSLTVGGGMFVGNVLPGGGRLAGGELVTVTGGGFDPAVDVRAEGLRLVSSAADSLTLEAKAPMHLDGVRIRVKNPDNEEHEYFSYLRAARSEATANTALRAVVPVFGAEAALIAAIPVARVPGAVQALGVQNPGTQPTVVTVAVLSLFGTTITARDWPLEGRTSVLRSLEEWLGSQPPPNAYFVFVRATSAVQMASGTASAAGLTAVPVFTLRAAAL